MSFELRNFGVMNYAQGNTQWHYRAGADSLRTCCGDGYFANAKTLVKDGDIVHISARDGVALLGISCMPSAPPKLTRLITAPLVDEEEHSQ